MAIVVVLPEPLIPTNTIIYGFSNLFLISCIKSKLLSFNTSSKLFFNEFLIKSSILPFNGTSTKSTFKSSFILSITSKATLFSNKASSKSLNNSSNLSSEIFLVVSFSVNLEKKPFSIFSSMISSFLGALFSILISVVSFTSSSSVIFFFLNNPRNPLVSCFTSISLTSGSSFIVSSTFASSSAFFENLPIASLSLFFKNPNIVID